MTPYGFHLEARSEFRESATYYEAQQIGLGFRFVGAVRDTVARVRTHPFLYREIEPGIRQCRFFRFPFGIIYRLQKNEIQILAVMHLHREPGYWKERVEF